MAIRRITKTALVAETITLDIDDTVTADAIKVNGSRTEVHVIGRDADNNPVVPGAGTFTVTAQTAQDGAFYEVSDDGTLTASLCGGSANATGVGMFATFRGAPLKIRVVPAGITTAISYSVEAIQIGD